MAHRGVLATPFLPISLYPVQRKNAGPNADASAPKTTEPEARGTPVEGAMGEPAGSSASVRARAAEGVSGPGAALPHGASIAAAFGHHDVGDMRAHVGGDAADAAAAIGADAYATGNHVAFANSPDLHTAAHEAAHIVQQRGGVQLKDSVGRAGDPYEQHADAVADRVVKGQSAEDLLDEVDGDSPTQAVQRHPGGEKQPHGPVDEAAALREEMGISLTTVPEVGGSRTAYVGGQVKFGLHFERPPKTRTVRARSWGMDTPDGRWSQVPTGPTTMLPITKPGAHRFWVDLLIDDVQLQLHLEFEAVQPSTRADALVAEQRGLSIGELRSQLALQQALLKPPGPGEQGANADLRVNTSAANPARQSGPEISVLAYWVEDRSPNGPGEARPRYHWYLKPFKWEGMPEALGAHPRAKLDDVGAVYDLGTGPVAGFPASHHGAFLVLCRADEPGKPARDARYLQSVLTAEETKVADKIVEQGQRMDSLGARIKGEAIPVIASHVAVQTAAEATLRLYLGRAKSDPDKWLLLDLTPGVDPEQHELEYQGQNVAEVLDNFDEDNRYPKGAISLRIDANGIGAPRMSRHFDTDGQTVLGTLSSRAGTASLLLGLGAIAAAPFTGGGSLLVAALVIGSAAAGAAAGALSLADHLKTEEVSETAVALDVLTIATSFLNAGMGAKVLRGGPALLVASRGGRFLLWTNFTLEGVSAVLVGVQGANQIAEVIESDAPPEEKSRLLVAVIANMILTGTMLAVSYGDLKGTRSRLRGHIGAGADSIGDADRLSLAVLDDNTLKSLRGADDQQLGRLAGILRDDPSVVSRITTRPDILPALKLARGSKSVDLELAYVQLRLQRLGVGTAESERLVHTLRLSEMEPAAIAGLSDDSLRRMAKVRPSRETRAEPDQQEPPAGTGKAPEQEPSPALPVEAREAPTRELGLRQEAIDAIARLENIKIDPLGDINSVTGHNHYAAARREAAGEVVARRPDGAPFSHIGDLQRAWRGLEHRTV